MASVLWFGCSTDSQGAPWGDLEVAGMAMYSETARDIFLASLLLPPGSPAAEVKNTPPPKAMEYRIATRRLSSRGFSGMVLLQAELSAGERAPIEVLGALTVVKRHLKGSLKRGDHFVILSNKKGETVFLLNDVEIYRVADSRVFDFFITGWVGANASATFKQPLVSGKPESRLVELQPRLVPTEERVALVRSWLAAPPGAGLRPYAGAPAAPYAEATPGVSRVAGGKHSEHVASIASEKTLPAIPAAAAAGKGNPGAEPTDRAPSRPAGRDTAAASDARPVGDTASVRLVPAAAVEHAETAPAPGPAPVHEVAAAFPSQGTLRLDDREYQRQWQEYVDLVMRQVYGEVKYPRRAIKYQWEGRVELIAQLNASGELIDVHVDSSSGHAGLDKAAEAAIKRAAPFPELTPVAREELGSNDGDGYVMSIPVTFALRD